MATKTFEELKQLAIQIRDEKTNKQNTATRVGTAMLEHINKLEQDYYDKTKTDEELKERDDKLTELSVNTLQELSLDKVVLRGSLTLSGTWSNVTSNQYSLLINIEGYRGKKLTVTPTADLRNRLRAFLTEYSIPKNGESVLLSAETSVTQSYPTDETIPNDAKYLYLCISSRKSIGYTIPSIKVDGNSIFIFDKIKDLQNSQQSTENDLKSLKNSIERNTFISNNNLGRFIYEMYVKNESALKRLFIKGIKRNTTGLWQFTIRGERTTGEIITVYNFSSTSEDIENKGLIQYTFTDSDESKIYIYFILDWSYLDIGINDYSTEYDLSERSFTLEYSPVIKSYLKKQDKLVSGENIKTLNGESLVGSGNISIKVGNTNNIGNVDLLDTFLSIKTLYGLSVICNSVSDALNSVKIYSKPNIQTSDLVNTISFPQNFNLKIGDREIAFNNILRSISFKSTNQTKRSDFTYSDDTGTCYISDSIEITGDGECYLVERVEEKIWNTGDDEPTIYLSTNINGLVDGATIYLPKKENRIKLETIADLSINNEEIVSTDNSYIYLSVCEYIDKRLDYNMFSLTKMGQIGSADLNLKGRNISYDADNEVLYICAYAGTLYKVDVSNDFKPKVIGKLVVNNTQGHVCSGCAIASNYLYVVDRNEGVPTKPSYLTIINKTNFEIVKQIDLYIEDEYYEPTNSAMSPCSCFIYKEHLFICGNSYFWAIYDITTNPENPQVIYKQTYESFSDKTYREYQRAAFWNDGIHDYVAFAGFSSGISIWNIDNLYSPQMIGTIKLKNMQCMDIAVKYPYMYIPCSGQIWNRFAQMPLCRSVVTFNISDLSLYSNGIDYEEKYKDLYFITEIPRDEYYPDILREGDPAPSRLTIDGDFLAVNYAEAGTAIFRIENNFPVFKSCLQLCGNGNTIQPLLSVNGKLFQVNIYGNETGMQVYRVGNINF